MSSPRLNWSGLLAFLCMGLAYAQHDTVATSPLPVKKVVQAFATTTPIVIDGKIDKAWKGKIVNPIDHLILGHPQASGKFGVLWDKTYLYFMAEITDAKKIGDYSPEPWNSDSVEVYLDLLNNGGTKYDITDDLHYIFAYGIYNPVEISRSGNFAEKYEIVDTPTGYRVEAALFWGTLGKTPATGMDIGFDVALNDASKEGAREGALTWNAADAKLTESPDRFGTCKLVGTPTVSAPDPTTMKPVPDTKTRVNVITDFEKKHQAFFGFGATTGTGTADDVDVLTPSQRARYIDAYFNKVKIRTGQVNNLAMEAPNTVKMAVLYNNLRNDDDDPMTINWDGYYTAGSKDFKKYLWDMAPTGTREDLYPGVMVNTRWSSPWLQEMRKTDYNRYLDEVAEQVIAKLTIWRQITGAEPQYAHLFNEPSHSGNNEVYTWRVKELIDILKRVGARVRAAGFTKVKFVVPSEETINFCYVVAKAMLADPEARQYIGVIAYHTYPYDGIHNNVAMILDDSGAGNPDRTSVEIRRKFRDLVKPYGVPLWQVEKSNPFFNYNGDGKYDTGFQSFDALRGRAIDIHDEFTYADASAYYGMNNLWSSIMEERHTKTKWQKECADDIVFVDQDADVVYISPLGYAMGHYARWITKGAVRVETASNDKLVLVDAFQDAGQQKNVWVMINNSKLAKQVTITLKHAKVGDILTGEQSTKGAFWKTLPAVMTNNANKFTIILPPLSVTTVSGDMK